MNISKLRDKLSSQYDSISDLQSIFEELEASYQQLIAMSEQVDQTEEKYALLIQNMSDIVWIGNREGKITYINEIVSDVLGYAREEMIGQELHRFMCPLHQYDTGDCKDLIESMLERDFKREVLWMLHKDGKRRIILETNTKRVYFDGILMEIQGVGRDVTERIQTERRIRRKNNQFEVLNHISSAITTNLSLNNLDKLLDDICNNVVVETKIPLCSIRLIDENGDLGVKAMGGRMKSLLNVSPIMKTDTFTMRAFESKKPIMLTTADVAMEHDHFSYLHKHPQVKSVHIFPLIANDKPLGTLMLATDSEYDDENVMMLTPMSNNIAFAIEKSNLYKNLREYYLKIITTLVAAMEAKDTYTQGHSVRVSEIAVAIAKKRGFTTAEIDEIRIAAILHDIGKIGVSDAILSKPGTLTSEEYEQVKQHPAIGMRILEAIDLSREVKEGILYHHLRWDLKGYPQPSESELKNMAEMPRFAKIIGVADSIDAMTSNRAYKRRMSMTEVKRELLEHSGTQFCPEIVEVALTVLNGVFGEHF